MLLTKALTKQTWCHIMLCPVSFVQDSIKLMDIYEKKQLEIILNKMSVGT